MRFPVSGPDDLPSSRREFLYYATGCAGCVAVGAAAVPLVRQMGPAADTRAGATMVVDVSALERGQQMTVEWQGRPVFIRRRADPEIAEARAVALDALPDARAENANLPADAPATDENRTLDAQGEWLVMLGICTHLGCVPVGEGRGDYGGWLCPCHGSHYDTAGRVRRGPAPRNLAIPLARFDAPGLLRLGVPA